MLRKPYCCAEPACSHAIVSAATREASRLSITERQIILGVLKRNELLQKDQQHRIIRLKAELQILRRKGALKPSADYDSTGPDPDRSCGRCRIELGRVINRGAYCRACRLKVCKGCREYSFRTTEWVCTVCHKHMEIQAASGEWMNEFVRRPSRRRDNIVYVSAADIIKRTIRRSWTISNPTPRWNTIRNTPENRPYNSLPRNQDLSNYPSLAAHKTSASVRHRSPSPSKNPVPNKHCPAKRSHSEDVYNERKLPQPQPQEENKPQEKPPRINPLIKYAASRKQSEYDSDNSDTETDLLKTKRKLQHSRSANLDAETKVAKKVLEGSKSVECPTTKVYEKRVSFDGDLEKKNKPDSKTESEIVTAEVYFGREEGNPIELCDIEPLSGTVFRKVTVRRRRQDMRKMPAVDAGWRRGTDAESLDILLPEGDDYKLVFISSDSSSKEEDIDDNDSSSTASSFLIDECDWDYFEPGGPNARPVLNWNSPFGSPRVYRRATFDSPLSSPLVYRRQRESDIGTDEETTRLDSGSPASSDSFNYLVKTRENEELELRNERNRNMEDAFLQCIHQTETNETPVKSPCQSCGAPTQYVPIAVPVPIPVPMSALWNPQDSVVLYTPETMEALRAHLRVLPRALWPYLNQAPIVWPLISSGEPNPFLQSVLQNSGVTDCITKSTTSMPVATDQNTTATQQLLNNDQADVNSSAAKIDENMKKNESDDVNIFAMRKETFNEGYLESESKYMSSSSEEDDSDLGDDSDDADPKYTRTYNVAEVNYRESDDALPSSDVTDCDDGQNSVHEDDVTSSGSDDTDSDDTGTVSDKKRKKFSRIYVVNTNDSSSSSNNEFSSNSASSDNDTDIERDCEIVLTCIKPLKEYEDKPVIIKDAQCDTFNDCDKKTETSDVFSLIKNGSCVKEYMSSPGLSDVSAESLNSSDADIDSNKIDKDGSDDDDKSLSELKVSVSADRGEWNENTGTRSDEPVNVEGTEVDTRCRGEQAGVHAVINETDSSVLLRHAAARYTSLVMITQDSAPSYAPVSVVTSDTTTLVADNDVIVRHTNWQEETSANKEHKASIQQGLTGYFTLTLENSPACSTTPKQPVVSKTSSLIVDDNTDNEDVTVVATSDAQMHTNIQNDPHGESVTVITGADTLSAVVCLEEGLADDDSWVENLSHDEDDFDTNDESSSGEEVTLHCTAAIDHEDELRGYHRAAIDFTLHTIVEESCEESEVEQTTNKKIRPTSATDLEKYFYFGLGDGNTNNNANREDTFSETSSICSESMDSFGCADDNNINENADPAELASSRLEKYFLSGFTSFKAERRDSDGSVGSDSEGRPSPEQRRKRLVRARGTGRSHSSSLDNLLSNPDLASTETNTDNLLSENSSSSDTDTYDDSNSFEKNDGQFDTVKRKKNKKQKNAANGSNSPAEELKALETTQELNEECPSDEDGHKTPQPSDMQHYNSDFNNRNKQQSRDSGFIGSNDDLNKDTRDINTPDIQNNAKPETKTNLYNISEEKKIDDRVASLSTPPATSLTRKDSFNNWSSDEETNLMMCKMRQFFKTLVANNNSNPSSKPSTPIMGPKDSPKTLPSPRLKNRCKPPQLVYFENELTRLMKTVPGIRDDQVREIVEYLSSEDTWSDSYDSSDYTSSDLEGTAVCNKSVLQQQISDSCKEIINKFDNSVEDEEGDEGDGGIIDESQGLNRETAFVYQKLVASFEKMATGDNINENTSTTPHNSPPLIAKVMHHIGSRLVALMHEVSSGESHASNSPKTRNYHRRLQQKLSSTTTTEDDDSTSDTNLTDKLNALEDPVTSYNLLPRSKSHDLLVSENRNLHQSSSGVSDIAEERETSDCERFSWRGSFESALLATESRNKLSLIGAEGSASASALAIAAKRRSAGDLLFSHKSLSREQLDRVRSCGSIGGANSEDKLWVASATRPSRRRSSVPDASCGSGASAEGEDDDEEEIERGSTLPRSLQVGTATTNSLPRLPTNTTPSSIHKAQSMYHFLQQNVKSARYRAPGFNRLITSVPKRAVSAPGLQPTPQRRGRRPQTVVPSDEISLSEAHSSPMLASRTTKSATPSPVAHKARRGLGGSQEWKNEDDIDRLVAIHTRSSLSSLGLRSDSMASVYSGAGEGRYGTVTVKGQVEFGLQYNYKAAALEINVKQCKDLAAVDMKRNRSDPYVKVYLLPDKSKSGKRKTKVKKHTLNPVFDECLKFHISLNGLETRTLWLTVWHSDMFGRNDFLGEVMMALENKVFDDPTPRWYNLQERTEPFDDMLSFKGDILVGLKFVPPDMTVHKKGKRSRGALHVLVKEAKSLTAVKANGTSDPFCKSYLLPDKGRSGKQKTSVMRRAVNPVWNHTFVYDDVTLQELAERCLELTVWDHDRLASNEFLGGVRFSLGTGKHYGKNVDWMDATGKELTLWKSMLERPNFWVEGCLSLRPTLDHRTTTY